MYVDVNTIITGGSLLTAVVFFSAIFAVYKWYLKQNQQDKEIERMKSEQCLLTYGILKRRIKRYRPSWYYRCCHTEC